MTGAVKLGDFTLERGMRILAPMAGYTDIAFRSLCREHGAALAATEMVSVRGKVRNNAATEALTRIAECERPSCVQLFGNEPEDFARAATELDCDIIDINMGCPMPKIVKNGDGAALLLEPERAGRIVKAIKRVTDRPVTVKTRIGYNIGKVTAGELIKRVADAGASLAVVHGRFAEQRYAGASDADAVKALADKSSLPIVYNGDVDESNIDEPEREFGIVAIGRGALNNPCIFDGGHVSPVDLARRHIELLTQYFDERYTVNAARKFFGHYFKGVPGGRALRESVNRANSVADVQKAVDDFRNVY